MMVVREILSPNSAASCGGIDALAAYRPLEPQRQPPRRIPGKSAEPLAWFCLSSVQVN